MAMISLGAWGGSGGNPWSYKPSSGVTEIVLRVRGNIKSISFTEASGLVSGTFGAEGNDRGEETKIRINWPSEYLTSISGTYGSYGGVPVVITSLSFITNLTAYGPFGNAPGKKFSIPIADSQVVGFHGRRGYYLDALGIFVRPTTIPVGPWGGPSGTPFSFKVESRISEIIVHHGTDINTLVGLSFKDSNGTEYGKFGAGDPNDIGKDTKIEIKGKGERLTSITGTYGQYKGWEVITSLSFITNLTTYGPFGTAGGTSFSIPTGGSVVIGFHGRAGWYLVSIGLYVATDNLTS